MKYDFTARKGAAHIFVYIFIMIAGGLVLLLFFMLAGALADNANAQVAEEAFTQVTTILATQENSVNTYTEVKMPDGLLEFTCDLTPDVANDRYVIGSNLFLGDNRQILTYDLVAARELETDFALMFSQELALPYGIGNVLVVTSVRDEKLALINPNGNPQLANAIQTITQALPEPLQEPGRISTELTGPVDAAFFSNTRVVQFYENSPRTLIPWASIQTPLRANVIAVYPAQADVSITERAIVRFYDNRRQELSDQEFHTYGMSMLLAYIYAGDEGRAACLRHKIATRLRTVTYQQRLRAQFLQASYASGTACYAHFSSTPLTALIELTELVMTPSSGNPQESQETFETLPFIVEDIVEKNDALSTGGSCATYY